MSSMSAKSRVDWIQGALSWQILHELQGLNPFLVHADDLKIQQLFQNSPESPDEMSQVGVPQHISLVQLLPLAVPGQNHQKGHEKMQVKTGHHGEQIDVYQFVLLDLHGQFGLISSSAHQLLKPLLKGLAESFGPQRGPKRSEKMVYHHVTNTQIHSGKNLHLDLVTLPICIPRWQHPLNQAGRLGPPVATKCLLASSKAKASGKNLTFDAFGPHSVNQPPLTALTSIGGTVTIYDS